MSLFDVLQNQPTVSDEKQNKVLSIAEAKARLLGQISADKQQRLGGNVITPDPVLEQQRQINQFNEQKLRDFVLTRTPETIGDKAVRSLSDAAKLIPMSGYGLGAGAGAIGESAFGEGGLSTKFKEKMLEGYTQIATDISRNARPEDSFTYSYQKAKDGDWGALGDWAAYNLPNVVAQLGTILIGAGVVSAGTQVAGKTVIKKVMGGLVKKETDRLIAVAAKAGQTLSQEAAAKLAVSRITQAVGQHAGMGAMSFGLEGGEIMGDLAQQSSERGTPLTGKEIGKGLTATALAGTVEYMETVLGLKAFKGQLGKVVDNIDGVPGRLARGATTAGIMAPAEFAQEYTQTGIEQWGKGVEDLMSEEAKAERLDAGMAGALMGPAAGTGATLSRSNQEQKQRAAVQREKDLARAEAKYGFDQKVAEVAKTGDTATYIDPEKPEYNPLLALKAKQKRSQDPKLKPIDKIANFEDAADMVASLKEQKAAAMAEMKELRSKAEATDADNNRIQVLFQRAKSLTTILETADPLLQSMKESKQVTPEQLTEMKTALKQADSNSVDDTIFEIFGSTGGIALLNEDDVATIDDLLQARNLTEAQKNLISSIKDQIENQKEYIRQRDKSPVDVRSDIIDGNAEDGFMGITDHHQGIGIALIQKDVKQAENRLNKLRAWADQKQVRASTFRAVQEAVKTNQSLDPDTQANWDAIQAKRTSETDKKGNPLKPYTVGPAFEATIKNMEQEAKLLNQAVVVGENMVEAFKNKNKAATEQSEQTPGQGVAAETQEIPIPLTPESPDSPRQQSGTTIPTTTQTPDPTVPEGGDAPRLHFNEKVGRILTTDNKGSLTVNSLDELVQVSQEFDALMQQKGRALKDDESSVWAASVLAELNKLGVPFTPVTVSFKTDMVNAQTKKSVAGRAIDNTINLNETFDYPTEQRTKKMSPATVFLHEYTHVLTSKHLDSQSDLIGQAKSLMDHVLKQDPGKQKGYAFTNEKEFVAQAISSRPFQEYLNTLPPMKADQSLVDTIKELFFTLVQRLKNDNPTALTDALALVQKIVVADQLGQQKTDNKPPAKKQEETKSAKPKKPVPRKKQFVNTKEFENKTAKGLEQIIRNRQKKLKKYSGQLRETIQNEIAAAQEILDEKLELVASLQSMGFTESEANELSSNNNHMQKILEYKDSTIAELEGMKVVKGSAKADVVAAVLKAKKRIETVEPASAQTEEASTEEGSKEDQRTADPESNPEGVEASEQEEADTETDVDPDIPNKLFLTFGKKAIKKGIQPLMQKTHRVLEALKNGLFANYEKYFSKENPFNENTQAAVDSIVKFGEAFQAALHGDENTKRLFKAYTAKGMPYRDTDPIQYLVDAQGNLAPKVVNAMMAVSYKYLATRASETVLNDEKTVGRILALKDDQKPTQLAMRLLRDKGVTATMLQEQLGQDIYKLLGMEAQEKADFDLQNRLEISLGLQAMATMEHMGYLTMTKIFQGTKKGQKASDSVSGLEGLKNEQKADPQNRKKFNGIQNRFELKKDKNGKWEDVEDEGAIDFYRVRTEVDPETGYDRLAQDITDNLVTPYQNSKTTWDLVFEGEVDKKNYRWKPLTYKEAAEFILKKTGFKATKQQTKNLINSINKPYVASARSMNFFLLLDPDNLKMVMGFQDPATAHKVNQDSVEGVNFNLEQNYKRIQAWLADAAQQPNGYASELFIPAEFWRQGRMGQVGDINPQGSKVDRFLFNMKGWEAEFNPTDIDAYYSFMEAVSLALDIEVSKEGGLMEAVEKTEDKLQEPVFQDAIKAVQKIIKETGDLDTLNPEKMAELQAGYKQELTALAAATKEGGLNIHSMKGIIEYARYLTAVETKQKTFKTDLPTEIDGVSNGPAIGRVQLMGAEADRLETLAALQNAGISFDEDYAGLAQHLAGALNHDAYQAVGFAWANALTAAEKLIIENDTDTKEQLQVLNALKNLFGDFREADGNITKIVRKLSKDPTMKTVYGMGENTLLKELGETAINLIYTQMETIAASKDADALRALQQDLIVLTEDKNILAAALKGDVVDSKVLLNTVLTDKHVTAITNSVSQYHGQALSDAITNVYGDMQATFAPLNTGINLAAAMYNTMYKLRVKELQAQIAKSDEPKRKITVEELRQIEADLQPLFPQVKTYMGGKIPLAKETRNKEYGKDRVIQSYTDSIIPLKKGAPYKREGLEAPGVAGTILTIHDIDSMIANMTLGLEWANILNNHDGFTTSFLDAVKLGQALNEHFYTVMKDYDMGVELNQGVLDTQTNYQQQLQELLDRGEINSVDVKKALLSELKSMKITHMTDLDGKPVKINENNMAAAIKQIIKNTKETAAATKKNKDWLVSIMQKVEQYSYPGAAYIVNQNKTNALPAGDVTRQVTNKRQAELDMAKDLTKEIKAFLEENNIFGSSVDQPITIDPAEYVLEQEINGQNVLHLYNQIKNDSSKIDSAEHDQHLQNLLNDLVRHVMQPIDVYLKSNPYAKAYGAFVPGQQNEKGRIFISKQPVAPVSGALNSGIRMSTGEVYTHELYHTIIAFGLRHMPGMRNKVEMLYRIAFKKLGADGYKVFLNDPTIDVTDPANQFEVEAAQQAFNYIFREARVVAEKSVNPATGIETTHKYSTHLDEFMAYAATNENFRKAMLQISLDQTAYTKTTWAEIKGPNIQTTLMNIARKIFQFVSGKFVKFSPKDNMAAELDRLAFRMAQIDSKNKTQLFEKAKAKHAGLTKTVSDIGNKTIKAVFTKTPVIRIANDLRNLGNAMRDSDTALGQSMRGLFNRIEAMDQNMIKAAVTEGIGRTDKWTKFYWLLNRRHMLLDTVKQAASDTYSELAVKLFKTAPTVSESVSITKIGLKPDLAALLPTLGADRLLKVLQEPKALNQEIDKILAQIRKDKDLTGKHKVFYQKASDALGWFMVHGFSRNNEDAFQSVRAIAGCRDTQLMNSINEKVVDRMEPLIDQLVSLYALQYTNRSQRAEFAALMEKDPEGVVGVLNMHQVLKEQALEQSFNGNKYLFQKGYIKEILNPRIKYEYGTKDQEEAFIANGYTRSLYPVARDPLDPTRQTKMYIYTSKTGRVNDRLTGIVSFTGRKPKGTNSQDIALELDVSTKVGRQNNADIIKDKQKNIQAMMDPTIVPTVPKSGTHMVPQFNRLGNIVSYRYMMTEVTKDSYLEKVNDFDAILGGMAGQIVDKVRTPVINKDLVIVLKEHFDKHYQENPAAFVEVGPSVSDPKMRELYYMMPDSMKAAARKIWGNSSGKMFVAKEILDLVFGYRKYGIAEAFTKNKEEQAKLERLIVSIFNHLLPKNKGIIVAHNLEQWAMELTKIAKSNIIVKSLTVTMKNLGSNMFYLKGRGIPTSTIINLGWEAWYMGTKYQADTKKRDELLVQQQLAKKAGKSTRVIDNELMQLEDSIARNPVRESIESGLMPSLVDDLETAFNKSYFPGPMEQLTDKGMQKLHPTIQNVGKIMFMTQDTNGYKLLNNAVKMTDFIGRHILYTHYTKVDKMDKAEAAAKAMEEFVNFDVPTHRLTEYFNEIGLFWFTKYGVRILKPIYKSIIEKPFDVAMSIMMASHLGADHVYNSIPLVTSDPLNKIDNPVGSFLGSLFMPVPLAATETILSK
jgi:hypothetical protein